MYLFKENTRNVVKPIPGLVRLGPAEGVDRMITYVRYVQQVAKYVAEYKVGR